MGNRVCTDRSDTFPLYNARQSIVVVVNLVEADFIIVFRQLLENG